MAILKSEYQPTYKDLSKHLYRKALKTVYSILKETGDEMLAFWNTIRIKTSSQKLSKQKLELEKSNLFKDQILSIIGHDMRAPFTTAKSLLSLLEDDRLTETERQKVNARLHADIDLSLQTLDNILIWASQSYCGAVAETKIKKVPIDVVQLLQSTLSSFSHLAEKKNVQFLSTVENITIYADHQQLAFILRNLTSNALKFSYPGQQIYFLSEIHPQYTLFSVKDEGMGMSVDVQASLFQVQNRCSKNGTAQEKGTGLGLIFCQDFVKENGGEIWIESAPGKGTTVHFTIPHASFA